jgi:hypothetical protein
LFLVAQAGFQPARFVEPLGLLPCGVPALRSLSLPVFFESNRTSELVVGSKILVAKTFVLRILDLEVF